MSGMSRRSGFWVGHQEPRIGDRLLAKPPSPLDPHRVGHHRGERLEVRICCAPWLSLFGTEVFHAIRKRQREAPQDSTQTRPVLHDMRVILAAFSLLAFGLFWGVGDGRFELPTSAV